MQPQREIPIEDEPDEAPINEYEIKSNKATVVR